MGVICGLGFPKVRGTSKKGCYGLYRDIEGNPYGYPFRGPYTHVYSTLGSMLGSPMCGTYQVCNANLSSLRET